MPQPHLRVVDRVEREWQQGDTVRLDAADGGAPATLGEEPELRVSVNRGPLTYSLKIGERWERYGGTDQWPAFEVFPTTPWNYGLVVDSRDPAASFEVIRRPGDVAPQPFTPEAAPIALRAKGKRVAEWQARAKRPDRCAAAQPAALRRPAEEITLIPMGCARLRVSAFPW